MQTNEELRTKYGIELHMVESYHPVPIIRIPGGDPDLGVEDFGEMAAVTACIQLKVKDQHDTTKLKKIKKSVYNKGFYAGVMTVGKYSKRRRSNVAVIIDRIVFISPFLFYCLLLNYSFPTNPNRITNCFQLFSLFTTYNYIAPAFPLFDF